MLTCIQKEEEQHGQYQQQLGKRKHGFWEFCLFGQRASSMGQREEPDEVLTGYVEQRSKIHRHRMQSTKQLCLGPKSWSSGCGKMILCRGRLSAHCTEGLGERCLKEDSSRIAQPPPPFSSKGAQGWGCGDAQALTGSLTNGSVINADGRISKSH